VDNHSERTFPVVELFGPVIEGEGPLAGQPTTFIRFGLCDSRCGMDEEGNFTLPFICDSLHSVLPNLVKANARQLTTQQIFEEVVQHASGYPWITFSGGNPVLHQLTDLVRKLRKVGFQIKVETQGTLWADWLAEVDMIVLSPKPPSAGTHRAKNAIKETAFYEQAMSDSLYRNIGVKIVVFDGSDLEFAVQYVDAVGAQGVWLSCGTRADDTRDTLGERYAWLCTQALKAFEGRNVAITVLPQLHVIAFLHRLGV
jgi:7-carboxy-7-deazaguanine synthase